MSYADNAGRESSSTYRELSGILMPHNRTTEEKARADVRCFVPQDEVAMHWATKWLEDHELEEINKARVQAGFPELIRLASIGGGKFRKAVSFQQKKYFEHEAFATAQAPQEVPEVKWYQD